MKRICFKYLRIVLLTIPVGLTAQIKPDSVLKFSLTEAQTYALQNNKSILNANLDVESAKLKVWETTAMGLPQVNIKVPFQYTPTLSPLVSQFSGFSSLNNWMYAADQALQNANPANPSFGHIPNPGAPNVIDPNDQKWSLNADIVVSQLIFSGAYIVGLQSAKVYQSLSKLNQVKSRQDVLESVTNSYFNLLIARENKMILDSTYQNLLKTQNDMLLMNKQGFVEETDVEQMQITVSNVKSSLDMITRMEDISEKLLKIQLADFVLENNVTFQMLAAPVKSQELLLKLRKSEYLPDLAAYYQYEKVFNDKAFTFNPTDVIGVSLNIPIFSSGARMAKVGQAKRELLKARNNKQVMADNIYLDYYSSRSALMTARDKYQTETTNMDLAKKIYNRSLIKYTNGTISSSELTQAQNQFLTSQSNYYTAIQNLITTKNKLEKLLNKSDLSEK